MLILAERGRFPVGQVKQAKTQTGGPGQIATVGVQPKPRSQRSGTAENQFGLRLVFGFGPHNDRTVQIQGHGLSLRVGARQGMEIMVCSSDQKEIGPRSRQKKKADAKRCADRFD